ncbi:omega-amidase NIT2-like [Toxorhynchites rutilus septentrionalis]|uniref:omega-amidase NIT2-like n=1 Tax=Toxorhynchites rutilus septentrionalis TaxID=329112 RepID=UPI002479D2FA|nr:omega-amidase NIT2-like [Toxorhynchites rutilus septentrionalis]
MAHTLKIAALQLGNHSNKREAINNAVNQIHTAAKDRGAKLVILPECWNSPYDTKQFAQNAEHIPNGETSKALAKAAADNNIYLVGGTYPEEDGGKVYNTCPVWGPKGEFLGKYRKMHLFEVNIPGKVNFNENNAFTHGNNFLNFNIGDLKAGVGICYDQRFAEFAAAHRQHGCDLLIYPSQFDTYTGPMHFEVTGQARALDNSMFVVMCSMARDTSQDYAAYGYSAICDPWGRVMCRAREGPEMLIADLDLRMLTDVKKQVPIIHQKRNDIYELKIKK